MLEAAEHGKKSKSSKHDSESDDVADFSSQSTKNEGDANPVAVSSSSINFESRPCQRYE